MFYIYVRRHDSDNRKHITKYTVTNEENMLNVKKNDRIEYFNDTEHIQDLESKWSVEDTESIWSDNWFVFV